MPWLPPPNPRLQHFSSIYLACTLAVAILLMFFTGRWINPSLFQASLYLLAAIWAVAFLVRPFQLHGSFVLLPLAAAVGWGLFQIATGRTVNRWDTWMAVLMWTANLVALFLSLQVNASTRVRRRFLDILLYFAFVLSVVSVVQYFGWNGKIFWLYPTYDSAALGPFVNRDQYAAFVEMALPLALVQALAGGPKALRFAVMGAALYATVIAGASRAGALLVTAEVIVIPALALSQRQFSTNLRASAARLWLFIFLFVSVVGWAVLWDRFQDPEPLKGRKEFLLDGLTMVRDRPYFGVGLGNFQTAYPTHQTVDFGSIVNHVHDDWVEWAVDGGIPFALLMVMVAIWTVPRAIRTLWGVGPVAVMVHSIVDYPLQKPVLELWFFVLLGALAHEAARQRRQLAEDPAIARNSPSVVAGS